MREALKSLTGESLVYGLGQVSGRAIQLVLVPILTRALAPSAYGVWELVLAYSQTAVLVLVFGMDGALARFFYQEPDRAARIRMVSTSLWFRITLTVTVAAILALLAAPIADLAMGGAIYRKYLLLGVVTLPFTLLVLFANDVLRVTFQPWKFIALNVAQVVCVGGLSIWFVVFRDAGVVGVLYGKLFGDALSGAFGLVLIRHTVRPKFHAPTLRRMLSYGAPLVPGAMAYGFITAADRFILQNTRSLDEVAIYGLAMKFFAVVTMGVSAFQLAYGPFAFARAEDPDAPRIYARVLAAFVALGSFGALAAAAFSREALAILAPPVYQAAAVPAVFLAFAAIAQGAYFISSVGIGLALRTPLLGWCAGGAALVAVVCNVVLTPRFGPMGAAVSTFLGYLASATLTYVVAQRVHPVPYRGARVLSVFVIALALGIALAISAPAGLPGVLAKLGVLAVFIGVCATLRIWKSQGAVGRWPATP